MKTFRPTWVEVDLAVIQENTRRLCALAKGKNLDLIAVLKADAYGHGAVVSARAALQGGARMFSVATPEEGIELREGGIDAPILVMGAYVPGTADAYLDYGLTATLADAEAVEVLGREADAAGAHVHAHLKVDTGMGRLGVSDREALDLARRAAAHARLTIDGIYSHLATSEETDVTKAETQIRQFDQVLSALQGEQLLPRCAHILNSGGLLQLGGGSTNMARVGLVLFGYYPAPHLQTRVELNPALTWKSRVATVKRVPKGIGISYGHTYRTGAESTLATLPVGYADGFRRGLSSRAHVLIGGRRHIVAGRICMDQTIVDVGDAPVRPGDEAVLIGRQGDERITVEEWADLLDTINYEILVGITKRVPRVYVNHGGPQ